MSALPPKADMRDALECCAQQQFTHVDWPIRFTTPPNPGVSAFSQMGIRLCA